MNIIEKLKSLNIEDLNDLSYVLPNIVINWPKVPDPSEFDEQGEDEKALIKELEKCLEAPLAYAQAHEVEDLDTENFEITELNENTLKVCCGGDWQMPFDVTIIMQGTDLIVSSASICHGFPEGSVDVESILK